MSNSGKNILVTGANRGIGLALVQRLAKINGVKHIFACCRDPDNAKELIKLHKANSNVILIKLDVQDDQTFDNAYNQVFKALQKHGGLYMLINNAGVLEIDGGSFDTPERKAFQKSFDINSSGAVMVTAKFLPLLQKAVANNKRAIVANISSIGGSSGAAHKMPFNNVCYGMSKAALNYYTRMISEYLKDSGIIFVALCPGWVKTDMGGPDGILSPEESASILLNTNLG